MDPTIKVMQPAKIFREMSTFWKNGSKHGLVKLGYKDLEFGTLVL
jgi:hypothetical protein